MQKALLFIACLLLSVTVKAQTVDTTYAITDIYITQNGKRVEVLNGKCILKRKPFEIVIELVEDAAFYSYLSPDSTEFNKMKELPKAVLDTFTPRYYPQYYTGITKKTIIKKKIKYISTPKTYNIREVVGAKGATKTSLRRYTKPLFLFMLYYKYQRPTKLIYSQFIKIEWEE